MQSAPTLRLLKASLPDGQLPASYGVYFKNTLVALCHALEDHILESGGGTHAPLVLATFQRGKWYLQEAERYAEIARCSRHIAIAAVSDSGFATHPTSQLENVSLVDLNSNDSLANEWNLIILAPNYGAMLLCQELSPDEYHPDSQPQGDGERKFYGLWTFDRLLVQQAATILIEGLRSYNEDLFSRLQAHQAEITATPATVPADLTGVVSRIVNYLQTSQQQLVTVSRQARELAELEGRALRLNRNLAANKLQAFLRMAQRVDDRDADNPVASLQVAALAEIIGQILDLPTLKLRRLRLAGLLYRIGLAEAPPEVFRHLASELDERGWSFWRDRAVLGAKLLATMPELAPVRHIVLHHLEYWDGSGQPDGLKAEEIPLECRILGLAAYFQEQTQPRGSRPALSLGEAKEKCQKYSAIRFDPALVEALSTVVSLAEVGLIQMPDRPSQVPTVWLEEAGQAAN